MKQKLKNVIYSLIIISISSCNYGESNENTPLNFNVDNIKPIGNNGIDGNVDDPQFVALKFYNWYLKDIYLKKK